MSTGLTENRHFTRRTPQGSGTAERAITIASGVLLLAPLLRKRSIASWTAAAAGGALLFDGISGSCAVSRRLGFSSSSPTTERIHRSITVDKDAADLYRLWRNPETFTRLMQPFAGVTPAGENHVQWSIPLPMDQSINGEAVMVEARPNEMVHWTTMPDDGLQIDEWFRLRPAPQNSGTEVTLEYLVDFSLVPAGGTLRAISSFFDKAALTLVGKVLHNFKALAETGDIQPVSKPD